MLVVETIVEAHSCLQESVINWGCLLIATGVCPKSNQMFVLPYIILMEGQWYLMYKNNIQRPDLSSGVPLADERIAEIEHLPVSSTVKTLGLMTCPTGSSAVALGQMQQQGQEWVDQVNLVN
jgi:hypothetical protein